MMSFYLDDDDDDEYDYNSNSKRANDGFQCDNCGSSESYLDPISGGYICSECFTQSQLMSQPEEIDFDDAMGLVARTRAGTFIQSRRTKRDRTVYRMGRPKAPIENCDSSVPLPSLELCLQGFQRVLKACTAILCDLVVGLTEEEDGIDDNSDCDNNNNNNNQKVSAIMESVKTMWIIYLESWYDGAQYYGKLYPTLRFSLRDSFLSSSGRMRLVRTVAHHAYEKAKEEYDNKHKDQQNDNEEDLENDHGHQHDTLSDNPKTKKSSSKSSTHSPITKHQQQQKKRKSSSPTPQDDESEDNEEESDVKEAKSRRCRPIATMLDCHHRKIFTEWKQKKRKRGPVIGRKEAAIYLEPSMKMIAGMLWIAVMPIGITMFHILDWIHNGSLPLLNSFQLLSKKEQELLRPIRPFFMCSVMPPSLKELFRMGMYLQIACAYKPPKIIGYARNNPNRRFKLENFDKHYQKYRNVLIRRSGILMSPASTPMLTARLVSDLGFGQLVLNYSYAIMGIPIVPNMMMKTETSESDNDRHSNLEEEKMHKDPSQQWLPPKLKAARLDRIDQVAEVLAVMSCAIRMIPKWEEWEYLKPIFDGRNTPKGSFGSKTKEDDTIESENHYFTYEQQEDRHKAKRRKTLESKARFVPWTEEHLRLLGNGPLVEGYLDFLEEQILDTSTVFLPDFISSLNFSNETATVASDKAVMGREVPAVTPCRQIFIPYSDNSKKRKNLERTQEKQNNESSSHYYEFILRSKSDVTTMKPCNPNIVVLFEYMAYRTGVQPQDIENFAITLDEEIMQRFGDDPDIISVHPAELYQQLMLSRKERLESATGDDEDDEEEDYDDYSTDASVEHYCNHDLPPKRQSLPTDTEITKVPPQSNVNTHSSLPPVVDNIIPNPEKPCILSFDEEETQVFSV